MLFNSLEFAIFFPFVVGIYFLLSQRWRTAFLLVSSCGFYMAFVPAYLLILAVTIGIDYAAGIYLEKLKPSGRRALLLVSILATCLVLFVFKYFNFFTSSFVGFASLFGWSLPNPTLNIILPIGLSFHTFQSLSYVVEVYRGHQKAERDLVIYSTYVMFWPQLVAGPIERPQNLLDQFRQHHSFDCERIKSGLRRMAWGFFKKLVVADRLAIYVNDVYSSPQSHSPTQLLLATFFFAYQIYCDFSGYSDIAIGSARVLGFRLMENFNTPYHSTSIAEFWQRWHISLSTWFRDYLYIPLGGSRTSPTRWARNVLVTFTVSGLWHGANWTYVIWGFLNGIFIICGRMVSHAWGRTTGRLGWSLPLCVRYPIALASTFSLTCVAWIFFRASTLPDAWYILTHLGFALDPSALATEHFLRRQMPMAFGSIILLEAIQIANRRWGLSGLIPSWSPPLRWATYLSFTLGVLFFGIYRETAFIYFQF